MDEGTTLALLVARNTTTKSVFSTMVPRKSTGDWISRRLMAWLGFRGHHRELRQTTGADELDRVMEQFASDEGWCTNDCREQSSGQLEEQLNREEINPIS